MGISNLSFSATNINVGLDADKSATPRAGDMYLATDTELLYKCYVDDSWVSDELTEAKIDTAKPNIAVITPGSYAGNNSVNKAVAHGAGSKPLLVLLNSATGSYVGFIMKDAAIIFDNNTGYISYAVTVMDDTNFYVGNASSYTGSANLTGVTYHYRVIA